MNYSEKLFLLYILFTITLVGLGLNELFTNPQKYDDRIVISILVITSFFAFIFGSMKVLFVYLEKRNKTGLMERINFNRSIGFFLITVCGIVPRILSVFAADGDIQIHYLLTTTCLLIAIIAYLLFIAGTAKYCTWNYSLTKRIARWVVSIHAIILIISLFLVPKTYTTTSSSQVNNEPLKTYTHIHYISDTQRVVLYLYQIIFSGLTLSGCQEIVEILLGAIQLKANQEVKLEKVQVEKLGNDEKEANEENGAEESGQGELEKLVKQPWKQNKDTKEGMIRFSPLLKLYRLCHVRTEFFGYFSVTLLN